MKRQSPVPLLTLMLTEPSMCYDGIKELKKLLY